ncbi:MAG: Uma2 family endonuclease [Alphaproteobacteria bacterium]|nr:Uma2 family endonuclease [Alphaproteobacteria bacterium]
MGRLNRAEYHEWLDQQPKGRFERVAGEPVAMAPERWIHAKLKAQVWEIFKRELRRRNLPCEAAPDGMTVEIGDDTDYEPDALINCGPPIPLDAIAAPNPVVIVEVLSPGTRALDTGGKLADYFKVASVEHYLVVRPVQRDVIHHRREGDRIETRIVHAGAIDLDPPGIALDLTELFETL